MTFRNDISTGDYQSLRAAVLWEKLPDEQAAAGLQSACNALACYDGEMCVGFARILWDGGYIAYLSDVIVRPEYQGKGLGQALVDGVVTAFFRRIPQGWKVKIILVASQGKEGFYKRLGFIERPNAHEGAGMYLWAEHQE